MTHDELRNRIDDFDCAGMIEEPAVKALRAVVELHKPNILSIPVPVCCACAGFDSPIYPCETIQAIEKELNRG